MSNEQTPHLLILRGSSDWSAIYKDGVLQRSGDHYLIDEWLQVFFKVESEESDDFLQGGTSYKDVANTLDEVYKYRATREKKQSEAAKMREEAERLLAAAKELEKGE